jgi:RNA polymerase sigma factor (sigma-70 family)
MPTSPINEVIQYLRSSLLPEGADLTDGQLLECFVSRREPAALEALVRRHGPMVWGVCRRMLPNHHDAEDAFQATFLVLVRKVASIRSGAKVGNWLYGVAHQTALKARATRAKRKSREVQVTDMPEPAVAEHDAWSDLQAVLDQELSRLPERYRTVIVLCDLEGKTRKEAARQLRLPQGTVAVRLARARAMLAKRLAQHGVTVAGGTLAAVLSEEVASASVPSSVMNSTIKAVTRVAAGQAAATAMVSAKVAALTEGVVKGMLLMKLKLAVAFVVVLAITGLGVGHVLLQAQAAEPPKERRASERPKAPQTEDADREKHAKDDLAKLQGTWRLVRSESDGLTLDEGRPEIKDTRLVIDKSSVTMAGKLIHDPRIKKEPEDVKAVGTLTLDTKKNPKQVVFTWETNPGQGRVFIPPVQVAMPRDDAWQAPPEQPVASLRTAGQGVAAGLEPVTNSARRAEDLFLREIPRLSKEYFTQRGIYALDGDSLKLCFYFPGSDTKLLVPTEFSANAGSKRNLGTWKRVPPSDKGGHRKDSSQEGDRLERLKRLRETQNP